MFTTIKYTKKIIFFILVLQSFFSHIYSQATYDPNDCVYLDIQVWENLGIVSKLPSLRPYPAQLLKQILNDVINSEYPKQSLIAKNHYDRLFGKAIQVRGEYQLLDKLSSDVSVDNSVNMKHVIKAGVLGNLNLTTNSYLGFDLSAYGTNNYYADCLKFADYTSLDSAYDPVNISDWKAFIDMNTMFSYGTDKFYVNGGISRSSYGPFVDSSIVLGNQAYHTGNLNVVYRNSNLWQYEQSFFILGATNNQGSLNIIKPEKYATLHTITIFPWKWLSFSYFETVVYGRRFEPIYFLPAPYMVSQSIGAFSDNLEMGLSWIIKPFTGFKWASEVLVDDISMNELLKFDFDTKIKMAGQTGVEYSFADSFISKISLGYTLVAPYMYTHCEYEENGSLGKLSTINYQNYTNNGIPMGSNLPPNSDRIKLSSSFSPIENLNIDINCVFIRHANVNESIPVNDAIDYLNAANDKFTTDGSIFNYPDAGKGYLQYAQENFMFMAQNTKMYIWQIGTEINYSLPTEKIGRFVFNLCYDYEYITNYGVQNQIYHGGYTNATEDDVLASIQNWKANLKDVCNHYVKVSVKYIY